MFPIALGEGKRLFEGITDATTLELVDVKTLKTGTLILTYRRP
jgi:dihydrofolate reductase